MDLLDCYIVYLPPISDSSLTSFYRFPIHLCVCAPHRRGYNGSIVQVALIQASRTIPVFSIVHLNIIVFIARVTCMTQICTRLSARHWAKSVLKCGESQEH